MDDEITLNADEVRTLIHCLMRAVDVGRDTGNLDLQALAEPLIDLLLDKWFNRGES